MGSTGEMTHLVSICNDMLWVAGWEGPGTALWRCSWSTTALHQHNGARMLSPWRRSWVLTLDWMARWLLSDTRHSTDPGSLAGFLSVSSMELSNSVRKIDINKAKIFYFCQHDAVGGTTVYMGIGMANIRSPSWNPEWGRMRSLCLWAQGLHVRGQFHPGRAAPSYWYGSASRNMKDWLLLGLLQLTQANDNLAVLQPFWIKSNLHKKWDEIGIASWDVLFILTWALNPEQWERSQSAAVNASKVLWCNWGFRLRIVLLKILIPNVLRCTVTCPPNHPHFSIRVAQFTQGRGLHCFYVNCVTLNFKKPL